MRSTPVSLTIGKRYELSGWVRTENLAVRDLDRSPISTGASLALASMPFDVHSESLGGARPRTRVNLRFTATQSQGQIVLGIAGGGAFTGKAWFEGVTLEELAQTGGLPADGRNPHVRPRLSTCTLTARAAKPIRRRTLTGEGSRRDSAD